MTAPNYNPDVLTCLANLSNDEVFTPPAMVNQMLDLLPADLWRNSSARFLDPACKTGVFLREIAKRLMAGLEGEIPDLQQRANHIFTKQLFGLAITQLTGMLSRRSVYCSKTANGQFSVCDAFTSAEGNIRFEAMQHDWKDGRCRFCGASQTVYDRGEEMEQHAYQFIHTYTPEEIFGTMKFDVIIGNPPYQLGDGGNSASAKPIYHLFVEQAKKLNPRYLCMIIPSRWFAGGKGLDEFRETMLNDKRIRYMKNFTNAKDCFPFNTIGGGVCYFLWNRDNAGDCDYYNVQNGNENFSKRNLSEFKVFVSYNEAIDVIHKVQKHTKTYLSEIVSSRNPFGLPTSERGENQPNKNTYTLYSSEGCYYIPKVKVKQGLDYIGCYKVLVGRTISGHAGETDKNGQMKVLSTLKVIEPNSICTDSYLVIGSLKTKAEVENLYNYLTTKFARFLILQTITSINVTRGNYMFVPMQDFSEHWTDEKLFKKYNLNQEEIDFIESMIRPME